jgi:hypothetical protein
LPRKISWSDKAAVVKDERRRALAGLRCCEIEELYNRLLILHLSLSAKELMTTFRCRESKAFQAGYEVGYRHLVRLRRRRRRLWRILFRPVLVALRLARFLRGPDTIQRSPK